MAETGARAAARRAAAGDGAGPMRFAYADPPYIGCAGLYPEKAEVDHVALIRRLVAEYADGWALSCHTPSLAYLLRVCHENGAADVRTMAWVKPFAVFKPNVGVAYAWEPVLVRGGRRRTREQPTIRDWFSASITLKRGLVGAKPDAFCRWILDVLNFLPGDTLDDLFPGTGSMARVIAQGDLLALNNCTCFAGSDGGHLRGCYLFDVSA